MSSLRATVVDYLLDCKSQNLSDQTIGWYEYKLRYFTEWCEQKGITEVEDIAIKHIQHYVVELGNSESYHHIGKQRSTYTTRGYAQVIKSFIHWCGSEGMQDEFNWQRIKMPKVAKRIIRTFTPEMLERLLQAASNEPQPWLKARDLAILHLLFDTGIRATELCTLRLDGLHLDPDDPYISVIGKGDKEREVGPLSVETQRVLRRYLRTRPKVNSDMLILGAKWLPLTKWGLDKVIERLERWAGPEHFVGVRVSAHTFRHTFAVMKLREGMDLIRISRLMGHNSLAITENYLKDFQQREARKRPTLHR